MEKNCNKFKEDKECENVYSNFGNFIIYSNLKQLKKFIQKESPLFYKYTSK